VITKIRSSGSAGYYLWGSRTAHALQTAATGDLVASHFLNIRQLCSTLKKDIYIACKQLTFSPNDALLWIDFQDKIRPTLERMKGDRGIKDYKMVKVNVSKKALMKAKIKIVPIEPVEDFNVGVYLEDSIDGLNATTTESEE
jgi:phage tail sheath protein FI